MIDSLSLRAVDDAVDWSLMQGLAFKRPDRSATHAPFSLSAAPIAAEKFREIRETASLLSRVTFAISEDHDFVSNVIGPVAESSPFFNRLLEMHHMTRHAQREPLLLMRSDFMGDAHHGPQLVEMNGVAAGMGPFGQRTQEMHSYLKSNWSAVYRQWSTTPQAPLIENPAIDALAEAIAEAAFRISRQHDSPNSPLFLMVIQQDEDNVFDQHMLEHALQARGVRTARRTLEELSSDAYTGSNDRLLLRDLGPVDSVYFRTGYAFKDYMEKSEEACCRKLTETRAFIEQHHVSVNATVSQQLATSKRMQLVLSQMSLADLSHFGLSEAEAAQVKSVLPRMLPVGEGTYAEIQAQNPADWVLKNQGEGGGHCLADQALLDRLGQLSSEEYPAWVLMQRLFPKSYGPALVVAEGQAQIVDQLVSEVGIFTVQMRHELPSYGGYLVRSKPADELEGGVHSGKGVLNSLAASSVSREVRDPLIQ